MGTLCQFRDYSLNTEAISVESRLTRSWWCKYSESSHIYFNLCKNSYFSKGKSTHKGYLAGLCFILPGGISGEPNRLAIITPGGIPHAERTPALTSKLWLLMRGVRLSQNAIFDSQENARGIHTRTSIIYGARCNSQKHLCAIIRLKIME